MNEENTKATLIEPVLRALGWDIEDVEEVQREFKTNPRHKPVGYGLLVLRTPRLLIEAEAIGENLSDHRWVNQIMGYASVAGVEWIVLTNGDEYRIYDTHAPVVVEEKLFRAVRVTTEDPTVLQTLELLAKNRMEENRIEVLWSAHFVDRQVKVAIENLVTPESSDMPLVNHVAGATKNLTAEEIRASIGRCRVSLDFPIDLEALAEPKRTASKIASSKPSTGLYGREAGGPDRRRRVEAARRPGEDLQAPGVAGHDLAERPGASRQGELRLAVDCSSCGNEAHDRHWALCQRLGFLASRNSSSRVGARFCTGGLACQGRRCDVGLLGCPIEELPSSAWHYRSVGRNELRPNVRSMDARCTSDRRTHCGPSHSSAIGIGYCPI
jgi:hypothetical protein